MDQAGQHQHRVILKPGPLPVFRSACIILLLLPESPEATEGQQDHENPQQMVQKALPSDKEVPDVHRTQDAQGHDDDHPGQLLPVHVPDIAEEDVEAGQDRQHIEDRLRHVIAH